METEIEIVNFYGINRFILQISIPQAYSPIKNRWKILPWKIEPRKATHVCIVERPQRMDYQADYV